MLLCAELWIAGDNFGRSEALELFAHQLRHVAAGKLPNFARLMRTGAFSPLRTVWPPQSPIVWSTFITGSNPGAHGVFDMLVPDRATYEVVDGLVSVQESRWNLEAGR